ncbi:MAG TPA: D-cysteine desulfhydrase family protein [bacterium]|nr:D-cysteine desulfhydrase family protein [bacterium]
MKHPTDFPRVPLAVLPTPLEPLERLGRALDMRLWMKRDDYTGLGGGGNKVRKLEFLMPEAIRQRADVIITTGGHQSNHARIVAAAARRFGMDSLLVLRGAAPNTWQGNLLLDRLLGAELDFLPYDEYLDLVAARIEARAEELRAAGRRPYVIPLGGASAEGALGYVLAVEELAEQWTRLDDRGPDYVVAAAGSAGTLAGLLVGLERVWPETRLLGISVAWPADRVRERTLELAADTRALLGWTETGAHEALILTDEHVGPRYAVPTDGGIAAIRQTAQTEGIMLDPVYTGKAMDGLIALARNGRLGRSPRVVFVHTGGMPSVFAFADALLSAESAAR